MNETKVLSQGRPFTLPKEKFSLRKIGRTLLPYAMVTPSTVILSVFVLYPIGYMIYLSFFKWNMIGPKVFIGLDNFKNLFSDADFWVVLRTSFSYMFLMVALSITLALLLAFCLKENTRINKILQSVVFIPHIVSLVSIAYIWSWMMDSDYGLLNYLLGFLNIPHIRWLEDPNIALFSLILVSVWKGVGYNTIILISSMETIPRYLYEAASLDNAKPHTVFFKITLPMVSPTLFFLTLMNMISAFKVFETVKLMTKGGPVNSTNTLVYSIYEYGFQFYKIGYASAMGVVLMVIIGACTLIYFRGLSRRVHYR